MNAVLPDDLSHYDNRVATRGGSYADAGSPEEQNHTEDWHDHAGPEMEPGTEMSWVGPDPLQ